MVVAQLLVLMANLHKAIFLSMADGTWSAISWSAEAARFGLLASRIDKDGVTGIGMWPSAPVLAASTLRVS